MTTAVSVHIMYYENLLNVLIFSLLTGGCREGLDAFGFFFLKYIYMYILCTMISVALLSCSVSSTNECPA